MNMNSYPDEILGKVYWPQNEGERETRQSAVQDSCVSREEKTPVSTR